MKQDEFLVQMDGCGTTGKERVLVVGATNRPQELVRQTAHAEALREGGGQQGNCQRRGHQGCESA